MGCARAGWLVSLGCIAACGRLGFDPLATPDGAGAVDAPLVIGAPDAAPGPGPLACGASRVIAELSEKPLGLGLVPTSTGVLLAWTLSTPANADTTLFGLRLDLVRDDIVSAVPLTAQLFEQFGDFGLVGDGDARLVLSVGLPGRAVYFPLGADLAYGGGSTTLNGVTITRHGVASPAVPGGPFAAAWLEPDEAVFARLDASGLPVAPFLRQPAGVAVAIRAGGGRHTMTWTAPAALGCAVWAVDGAFAPVIADPLIHTPGGSCAQPAITRHDVGVNLLMWIADGEVRAQLGTDADTLGAEIRVPDPADDFEIATAPSGFFYAIASPAGALPGHIRADATQVTPLATAPHTPGTPIRLLASGRDALLLTSESQLTGSGLWLTRLCEPGASAR